MAPYQVFFPLGVLFSVWGTLLWILYAVHLAAYPVLSHPLIMGGGFLLCFASGFLMTAVPKFTGTHACTKEELYAALLPPALLSTSVLLGYEHPYGYLAVALGYLNLIYFIGSRFLKKENNPFPEFVFVAFGILSGIIGSFYALLGSDITIAKQLMFALPFFFMIIGVGSRISTALLGQNPQPISSKIYVLESLALLAVTFMGLIMLREIISLLIILQTIIRYWKLWKLPRNKGNLAWSIWTACSFFLLGRIATLFFPSLSVHGAHLTYIGGFGLMTFSVATRVSLAHGNHMLIFERKDKRVMAVFLLIALAAATRVSAQFMPERYVSHLAYASFTWIVAVATWSSLLLPKILKTNAVHPVETFKNPFLNKQH